MRYAAHNHELVSSDYRFRGILIWVRPIMLSRSGTVIGSVELGRKSDSDESHPESDRGLVAGTCTQ